MENLDSVIVTISALGFITLVKSLLNFVRWVWVMFLRSPRNLKEYYGSWVLITGPTDGIGKALALELASKGLNLILIGRNPSKLEATSREILELADSNKGELGKYTRVQVRTIVMDLAKCGVKEICDTIERETKGLDIGVVVNNAGLAYPYAKFFDEVDLNLVMEIIKVNIEAATWITKAILPKMLNKKRGAIVNIGSASSSIFPSFPLYTVYAASKAYISMFSKSISLEYKKSGVDIQCQVPLVVATKMTANMKPCPFVVASTETYSKASVRSVGFESQCVPYWSHSMQWLILDALPEWLVDCCVYAYFVHMNKRESIK